MLNVASGLVLGITNASTADGALAVQWDNYGATDHDWVPVVSGTAVKLRCVNSGKILGVVLNQQGEKGDGGYYYQEYSAVADEPRGGFRRRRSASSATAPAPAGATIEQTSAD